MPLLVHPQVQQPAWPVAVAVPVPDEPAVAPQEPTSTSTANLATRPAELAGAPIGPTVCANCGTHDTPLWRRDPEGRSICNACGLYQKSRRMARPTTTTSTPPPTASPPPPASPKTHAGGGTCPGDGRCDGTGGTSACSGCPTYNNSIAARRADQPGSASPGSSASTPAVAPVPVPQEPASPPRLGRGRAPVGALSCFNCHTITTPLWRRDEAGNNICNACGLYLKLHGTHRPNSMKKTIIKRRKRVPAAAGLTQSGAGMSGVAMTVGQRVPSEQAAAEMLLAVGRGQRGSGSRSPDEQEEQGRRKRRRQSEERDEAAAGAGVGPGWSAAAEGERREDPQQQQQQQAHEAARQQQQQQQQRARYPQHAPGYVLPSLTTALQMGGQQEARERMSMMHHQPQHEAPHMPSFAELEHHYQELLGERRRLTEMMERTEWMLTGLRRGMDDMRAMGVGAQEANGQQPQGVQAVRLPPRQERAGEAGKVWNWENKES